MAIEIISESKKHAKAKVSEHLSASTVRAKVGGKDVKVIVPVNAALPALNSDINVDTRNRQNRPKAYMIPS